MGKSWSYHYNNLDFLYSTMTKSAISNILVCGTVSIYLINKIHISIILTWSLSIFIISGIRLLSTKMFKKSNEKDYPFFYWLFYVLAILTALGWGLAGFILFSENLVINTILLLSILGLGIAGVLTLSSDLFINYSFETILILPIVIRLLVFKTDFYITLAVLILLYFILIIFMSRKISSIVFQNIMFRERHRNSTEILRISENKFRTIFDCAPIGIFYFNKDLIVYDCNEEFSKILEAPKHKLINMNLEHINDIRILPAIRDVFIPKDTLYEGEYLTTISNTKIWITLRCSPLYDEKKEVIGAVGIVEDRTEMKLIEEQVRHLAYHDSLTGLPNRLLLIDRVEQAIAKMKRKNIYGAILFLDLDNFKTINDTLGHQMGDMILKETAERLKFVLRKEDTVSRIGGDEFVILLPSINENQETTIFSVNSVSEKIHKVLSNPFTHLDQTLFTSTSIGVNIFNAGDNNIDDLLKNADIAMYEAKSNGKSCTHYFNHEMNKELTRRLELEKSLRLAIENKELTPYFQPIYSGKNNKVVGAETLLRWIHPTMGLIPPYDFIPLAEETNLIIPIGTWLIESVCKQINEWHLNNMFSLKYISINISVNQLRQQNFVENVLEYTSKYNIPHNLILFEITETLLIGNFDYISTVISVLRRQGFRFALDDFGTGYSSLTYLKKLELDVIKIDRAFILDLSNNKDDLALVEAILSIANNFKMDVIAEGVEEQAQLNKLLELGCEYIQGYYYSKPIPENEFTKLLRTN
ncbi:MAG: EAL domain-containing protein [Spirochaetales bacterium]|nr:EAL domain-containing protein [Spirochaetales bacterium]